LKAAAADLGASFAKNGTQPPKMAIGEKQDGAMSRPFGTNYLL
jgi:hypothetical protein